jgi:RND family efflux transporter MFP subunit
MQKLSLNSPLHPSQEGNLQQVLQSKLPSSEGPGVGTWLPCAFKESRKLRITHSSIDGTDIHEGLGKLRQVLDCGSPLPLSGQPPKAPEGRRTPRRWRDAARALLLLLVVFQIIIQSAPAQDTTWIAGLTEPIYDITLSSPVIGIVGARPVEEGAFVKKGQVLIELDKSLEELEVSRKKLVQDLAKIEFERTKTLSDRKAISVSREEMDKKQTEFSIATVEHELAKEQLRKRLLIAPIDGFVTEIFLEVGEGCETRQPVVRLVDTRRCYFIANIEAKLGHSLKTGQKAKLQIETGASPAEVEGTISFVSPVVDPASGLMKVKLTFENPEGKIRPGVAGRMQVKP